MTTPWLRTLLLVTALLGLRASPAAAQSTMRLEQNDPSVTYSGNWWMNENAANTGGLAALTNTRGSRVSVSFNGTGISWIGVADAYAGLATVYLDGTMTAVNTYSPISQNQKVIVRATGLAPGPHTLAIEVTHERGPGTDGSWIWVDAFDIEGTPIPGGIAAGGGRVEENNPAMVYTGRWYANASPTLSNGAASLAMNAGSRASLTFTGTGISWTAYRDQWSGVANVYLDNVLKTMIDTYQSPAVTNAVVYSIEGLSRGSHTLTIEATGTRNGSSQGAWVWLDALDVVP